MNDKIKELLFLLHNDRLTCIGKRKLEDYITNLQKTNKNHSKKLIELGDKITNLQQENYELKSKLECYENGAYYSSKVDELEQENERLKETNVYCNRTDCIGRIKDSRKYDSVYQEKEDYKSRCEKASDFIDNFDVFKEFSFPLMKRDVEQQIKSSIDYEFKTTFRNKLKNILQNGSEEK